MILILWNVLWPFFSAPISLLHLYLGIIRNCAKIIGNDGRGSRFKHPWWCPVFVAEKRIIYSPLFITKFAIYFEVFARFYLLFFGRPRNEFIFCHYSLSVWYYHDDGDAILMIVIGIMKVEVGIFWGPRDKFDGHVFIFPLSLFGLSNRCLGHNDAPRIRIRWLIWSYRCCCRYSSGTVSHGSAITTPQSFRSTGRKNWQPRTDWLCVSRWLIKSIMECWVVVWLVVLVHVVVGEMRAKNGRRKCVELCLRSGQTIWFFGLICRVFFIIFKDRIID